MDKLLEIVSAVNRNLSDYVLFFLLAGTGIFFTIRTKFVQIRCFGEGCRNIFGNFSLHNRNKHIGFSSFQALATAIAAQVGTGNIVGASGAILTGGPGAIFWMWVIAFFGMATSYAEAVLAQETRITGSDGKLHGGPVYYIRKAFPNLFGKILAAFFAVMIIISLGLLGGMVQANSIGETCRNAFGIPASWIGIIVVIAAALIFAGGVSGIARVMEKLVPGMAMFYLAGGVVILIMRYEYLGDTFAMIFKYAFTPEALIGGSFGQAIKTAISQGVKRGLFSNEAGMGSTPHAHAIAQVKNPHTQGTVAMLGVFIDTAIVLTMTALIVISTIYTGDGILAGADGSTYQELISNAGLTKTNLAQLAVAAVWSKNAGNIFIAVCLFFFAFSTIISWNFFGRINCHYLFGKKSNIIFTIIALGFIYSGTLVKNELVWELQDTFNQLMVLPNVIALIALSGIVAGNARNKSRNSGD